MQREAHKPESHASEAEARCRLTLLHPPSGSES